MNNEIVYCAYSETIRQMPQNYMIARKARGDISCWCIEPDLAADPKIVCAVTLSMMEYENKYSIIPTAAIEKAKELYNKIEINI